MGMYGKELEPDVKELLELSTLYHSLVTELAELWGVTLTPALRLKAFQRVKQLADDLKVRTLTAVVLAEVKPVDKQ